MAASVLSISAASLASLLADYQNKTQVEKSGAQCTLRYFFPKDRLLQANNVTGHVNVNLPDAQTE